MVGLVREMLKHISLKDVVNGILKVNKHVKFRAVNKLISDVFWDKRAEVDLCISASSISYNELKEFQNDFFNKKGDGLKFSYTRCDICGMNVRDTSMKVLNNFNSGSNESGDGMRLILFDCSRESDYNHAYHKNCLKRVIREELRKDKKTSLRD